MVFNDSTSDMYIKMPITSMLRGIQCVTNTNITPIRNMSYSSNDKTGLG